jgi:O-antigen biosynthesis protein WbqV
VPARSTTSQIIQLSYFSRTINIWAISEPTKRNESTTVAAAPILESKGASTISVILSSILYFPLMILLAQQESLPRSVPFLNALVYIVLLCLPRFIYRSVHERHTVQKKRLLAEQAVPVLLVGNGDAIELFIREVMHSPALSYQPVGILSPNTKEKGRRIHTVPILGVPDNWENFVRELRSLSKRPVQIIITDMDLPHEFLAAVSNVSQRCSLPMMQMLPQFTIVDQPNDMSGVVSNSFLTKRA